MVASGLEKVHQVARVIGGNAGANVSGGGFESPKGDTGNAMLHRAGGHDADAHAAATRWHARTADLKRRLQTAAPCYGKLRLPGGTRGSKPF